VLITKILHQKRKVHQQFLSKSPNWLLLVNFKRHKKIHALKVKDTTRLFHQHIHLWSPCNAILFPFKDDDHHKQSQTTSLKANFALTNNSEPLWFISSPFHRFRSSKKANLLSSIKILQNCSKKRRRVNAKHKTKKFPDQKWKWKKNLHEPIPTKSKDFDFFREI